MATFRLKRVTFSDNEEKKGGMGTAGKVALGAGALAGGLIGARYGMFGRSAQMASGKLLHGVGFKTAGIDAMASANAKRVRSALQQRGVKMTDSQFNTMKQRSVNALNKKYELKGSESFQKTAADKNKIFEANQKAAQEAKKAAQEAASKTATENLQNRTLKVLGS